MFISNLIRTIEAYDPYGLHRLNGTKVVYVLLMLFIVNLLFDIPNPYFYFFYVPITAMSAEVVGNSIHEKYRLYVGAIIGTCIMVTLFNLLNRYPFFFLCFVFFGAFGLYAIISRKNRSMIVLVPIILSLSAYSLIYVNVDMNLHLVINNAITMLLAMIVVLCALILFPLSYYYRLWLRAFYLLTKQSLDNFLLLSRHIENDKTTVHGHTMHVVQFSKMLPRDLPIYTILKINLLINKLHLISCVEDNACLKNPSKIIQNLRLLLSAIEQEAPCLLVVDEPTTSKLIATWNTLCSRI